MKILRHSGKTCVVHEDTFAPMFKELDEVEVVAFEAWAKENSTEDIIPIFHPIVQNRLFELQTSYRALLDVLEQCLPRHAWSEVCPDAQDYSSESEYLRAVESWSEARARRLP